MHVFKSCTWGSRLPIVYSPMFQTLALRNNLPTRVWSTYIMISILWFCFSLLRIRRTIAAHDLWRVQTEPCNLHFNVLSLRFSFSSFEYSFCINVLFYSRSRTTVVRWFKLYTVLRIAFNHQPNFFVTSFQWYGTVCHETTSDTIYRQTITTRGATFKRLSISLSITDSLMYVVTLVRDSLLINNKSTDHWVTDIGLPACLLPPKRWSHIYNSSQWSAVWGIFRQCLHILCWKFESKRSFYRKKLSMRGYDENSIRRFSSFCLFRHVR